jgi:hypothetical protein
MRKIKAELSTDGVHRGAITITAELIAARTDYAALVAACWAGLRAGFDAQSPLADLAAWQHIADELDGVAGAGGGGARG